MLVYILQIKTITWLIAEARMLVYILHLKANTWLIAAMRMLVYILQHNAITWRFFVDFKLFFPKQLFCKGSIYRF